MFRFLSRLSCFTIFPWYHLKSSHRFVESFHLVSLELSFLWFAKRTKNWNTNHTKLQCCAFPPFKLITDHAYPIAQILWISQNPIDHVRGQLLWTVAVNNFPGGLTSWSLEDSLFRKLRWTVLVALSARHCAEWPAFESYQNLFLNSSHSGSSVTCAPERTTPASLDQLAN